MDRLRGILKQLRALVSKEAVERELDEELRFHVGKEAERLEREAGLDPREARRRALVGFGGVEQAKEGVRRARWTRLAEELARDIRFAVRALRRRPGVAAAAVLTLALGIGAATVIFSLFDSAYLRALPYAEADRLVALWQDHRGRGGPAEERFNPPDFVRLRESSRTLDGVAAVMDWSPTLTGSGRPERLRGRRVSHEYFDVLGVMPTPGRGLTPEDETAAGAQVVVLGRELWRRRFAGDPQVVGRTIELDGEAFTVAGVAPADFRAPGGDVAVWKPLPSLPRESARAFRVLDVVGRLAPGESLASARAELARIAAGIADRFPRYNAGVELRAERLGDRVLGPVRPALFALLAAVGLVLLVACANVAGLLVARGSARDRELAVRASLGAERGRLVRQFLTEGLVLGLLGGVVGVGLAVGGVRLLAAILPADALPGSSIALTGGIALGALGLSVTTAAAASLAPAIQLSATDLARWLRGGGGTRTPSRAIRARSALVVAEIALTFVLLVGAGLFLRNFRSLLSVDPGFRADRVLTAELSLPGARYPDAVSVSQFYRDLLVDVRRAPGVRSAGATSFLPLRGGDNDVSFRIDGRAVPNPGDAPLAWYRVVTPGYFRALGVPLRRGRAFRDGDGEDAPGVAVVNATLARRYWPDANPVGARVSPEWADGEWFTVVGVVGDVRHNGLTRAAVPEIYFPHARMAGAARSMVVVLRTDEDPTRFATELRRSVSALDPELPVDRLASMADIVSGSIAMPRLQLWTFGAFAVLALLLAAVGLYGVTSTVVVQRTREIGVRMATGARPADVMRRVLRWAAVHAAVGAAIGLAGALLLSRTMEGLLYGLSPTDPATFVAVTLTLVLVTLIASAIPARRAASVDPMRALRVD